MSLIPVACPPPSKAKGPIRAFCSWTRPCAGIETAGRGALAGFRREQSGLNLSYGADTEHTTAVKTAFTIEREAFEQFKLEAELPPTTRGPAALKEKMLPRLLGGLVFHLDANLINARQKQDPVNRMERWRVEGKRSINKGLVNGRYQ